MEFKNKVVIVTGGVHGIGKVMSTIFAKNGMKVVLSDINEEQGQTLEEDINKKCGEAFFVKTDLREECDIIALVDTVTEKFGGLDFVVNNARPKLMAKNFNSCFEEWDIGMDVLLKAPALLAKHAAPYLEQSDSGSIVNIGSTNSMFIAPISAVYHVAKAGLNQLTQYLACDLGSKSIRVNTVSPGLVDLYDEGIPLTKDSVNKFVMEMAVPLKRACSAEEIAQAVLFLFSTNAAYITGQNIVLDGGITTKDQFHLARSLYNEGCNK